LREQARDYMVRAILGKPNDRSPMIGNIDETA
jgi:hypothetical protein